MADSSSRPDPDALLEQLQQADAQAARGKLKVFFGANAGVGKTYAMLATAQSLREQGRDVLVGVVETHGRDETAALLAGLPVLPLREQDYRGHRLREFDLDGALARHPSLILMDELAHTNAPGSRHQKRWQDVEELLAAGIDVFTTVNVQHLESLNDVVGGITGVRVWETVPDRVFDRADEVVLVDLPPDELLKRLQEGKVYLPRQAERAIQNFFRKGNLIALRELALRRTADRVDGEMRAWRRDQSVDTVWRTRDSLLVAVGPAPGDEKVVRTAARLAARLEVPWHAVYVETPRLQRLGEGERARILAVLALAQELGAQTATLPGQEAAAALVDYARRHNLAKVVVGRSPRAARVERPWTWLSGAFRPTMAGRLARRGDDLDIVEVPRSDADQRIRGRQGSGSPGDAADGRGGDEAVARRLFPYVATTGLCALTTALTTPLLPYLDLANIVMLFLLTVLAVAMKFGRGPAVLAAFLSVLVFDFFFVPPRFSLAVSDAQYLLTFLVMLVVALVTGQLTANLRFQAEASARRELRSRALFELARELAGAFAPEQIVDICDRSVQASFGATARLLLPDADDRLVVPGDSSLDAGIADWVFDKGQPAGIGTDTLPSSPWLYLPLKAPMRTRGVLALEPPPGAARWLLVPEERRQLDTLAALVAIALERVHYIAVAQEALVSMESERLRNSLLSALSHDLRTPLTSLVGSAEALVLTGQGPGVPALTPRQRELAASLRDEALRMNALVNNLLDMARLESGQVQLNRQWHALEELLGSALAAREQALAGHRIVTDLPADLPLVECDGVLIERVLCNLLENGAKYTPPGSTLTVSAAVVAESGGRQVQVAVSDNGPGLAPGAEELVFAKFSRGRVESNVPGVGLGLAICRAIVEAHGGRIWAENKEAVPALAVSGQEGPRPSQSTGARFVFTLPLGTPPRLEDDGEEAAAASPLPPLALESPR
ncbi:two-component system, OmpR family, sensor histidine kinase [Oryzomicrobium terrae]|uniref:histidine kinase n=1 Tax=Oryzomicrobium terrae TaxID=1735038 RepID=A0A5C1EDC3_9RHOO|nr:two-component system sensor histidine kinase KdpD [Oryzomicrobium terrae]QEL66177.1 two-component system, OmpR family, sensor histidine kinase [Oryzomicrobium terrae]